MPAPLAFLLTWTCHGAWLHGDARGSVDHENFTPGTDLVSPTGNRVRAMRAAMTGDPITLTHEDRRIVDDAIREHCNVRGIWLGALNVRTNHVHCVVNEPDTKPEQTMARLKSWSTRALRAHDASKFTGKVWTRHGSTRHLWKQEHVDAAIRYVLEGQESESRWKRDG